VVHTALERRRVHVEETSYASEGQAVPARLFRPAQTLAAAAGVLLCPGRLREIDGLAFLAMAIAERGAVVLASVYRGMDMRPDDQDCLDGIAHLVGLPGIDPDRVAIVGHSRGAMASLRVAAKTDRVRAVVALQPVADLSAYALATRAYAPSRYAALAQGMGDTPQQVAEAYRPLSAIHYAGGIKVPVLLLAGTQDLHAPVDESLRMREALQAAGNTEVRLEVLEGVGHFFEKMYAGYVRDEVANLVVDWLARMLALAEAAPAAPA
jgi:dipeptidyl aminopeptidase/acylaminoacyl peptidase